MKKRSVSLSKVVSAFVIVCFLLTALITGCATSSGVAKKKGACYLKATDQDVYLKVFELDSNGSMGALIWQGTINKGQTARIETTHARFRFFYNPEPHIDQPFSSGEDKMCDDLDMVAVP
ncbi:MAG: hypothetical protein R3274_01780 [Desulfobacterales bacterium]|nr:hypothetical protein [Desulfobacterales bacterium]